jgi:hypothetical protein
MILDETVLQKLAEWQPPAGRQTLNVTTASGWFLTVTADRHDELGSLVWDLTLLRRTPAAADKGLADWASRIADRVTGLLEPLKIVEVDAERNEALLRSQEPARRGDKLCYYEVILKGTSSASVLRYQALPGNGKREQVTFALTNEALAKLVADLTAE